MEFFALSVRGLAGIAFERGESSDLSISALAASESWRFINSARVSGCGLGNFPAIGFIAYLSSTGLNQQQIEPVIAKSCTQTLS